ncbi:hypothetical protein ACFXAF_35790 [Kitasatospora sp. NPDC059463]|uniref:hypothetical protein n=1 Tax=unclassified Kitasatospora TaxID=2633591 RepID=UPI0036CF6060
MRAAFGPLIPTDPPAIALWLTKSAIDTPHDDLVTDLQEWLDPTDLSIPAHHVAELGLLAHDCWPTRRPPPPARTCCPTSKTPTSAPATSSARPATGSTTRF